MDFLLSVLLHILIHFNLKEKKMLFKDLNIIEPILKALEAEGYTQPTPIQEQAFQ
ncbi:MAG: hypothetical protein R2807_04485 [Chitinophagales bacterium]